MKTPSFALLAPTLIALVMAVSLPCRAKEEAPPPAPAVSCPAAADIAKLSVDQPVTVASQWSTARQTASTSSAPPTQADNGPVVTLRDEIAVHVAGLDKLMAREKCSPSSGKVVLFLDGRPVPSATPYPPVDPASEKLKFVLARQEFAADAKLRDASREVWTHLLGRPSFAERPLSVSVGLQNEYPIHSEQTVMLQTIPLGWFWAWTVLLVLLVGTFLALAVRSDVLRDIGPQPDADARKPYSLAKMQAAWWFFLILASYLFIGLVAGDYSTTITGTVLSLMGISAATAVGSAVIDVARPPAAVTVVVAGAAAPAAAVIPVTAKTKGHWWLDILSDEHGVNFHRFQMASWTLVLGVIFIHEVYAGLAMPVFDNALLGLLGISAGTYLGLKTTGEKS